MKSPSPDKIRNIALVAHGDAGKTSLAEAMLLAGKAILFSVQQTENPRSQALPLFLITNKNYSQ